MSDYAASLVRRLVEPPAIVPRRASPFEPERRALVAEDADSVVEVAGGKRAARPAVERLRAADGSTDAAGGQSLRPAQDAVQFARLTMPGPRDARRSPLAAAEGSAIAPDDVEAEPAAVASAGEGGVGEIESRRPPVRAADDTPVVRSIGSALVAPLGRAIEPAGKGAVPPASSLDAEKRPRPGPVKTTLAEPRQFATEGPAQSNDGTRESPISTPPQAVLSITRASGLGASAEPSYALDTEPTLESILAAPALPAGPVARPGPTPSLDPPGGGSPAAEPEPTVEVHIGRIEVKAITPPPPSAPPARPGIPAMTLDDYRRKRQERRP